MNKVLITGGNGFIARSLYEDLTNSSFYPLYRNVYAPTRQELDLLEADAVRAYLQQHNFDVVIHTATYDAAPEFSNKDSKLVLENNLKMFFNLSQEHARFGKMIYFGSGAEAGRENWIPKMTEHYITQQIPRDQYGASKHIMNQVAKHSDNIYNLRIFGLFGKFDDWRYRFISNACCKVVMGMPIRIKKNVTFDYTSINDLSKVVQWAIKKEPLLHSYNVCSGKTYDYKTIAEMILTTAEKSLQIYGSSRKSAFEYSGDNSLLLREMKDFAFTPLKDSVVALYRWYETRPEIIDTSQFQY